MSPYLGPNQGATAVLEPPPEQYPPPAPPPPPPAPPQEDYTPAAAAPVRPAAPQQQAPVDNYEGGVSLAEHEAYVGSPEQDAALAQKRSEAAAAAATSPPPAAQATDYTPAQAAPVQAQAQTNPDYTPAGSAPVALQDTVPVEQLPAGSERQRAQKTALEQVPIIGGPLQSALNVFRGADPAPYRPAVEGVRQRGEAEDQAGIQQAQQTLAADPSPGNLAQLAGAQLELQKGEPLPEGALNKRAYGDAVASYLQDPSKPLPDMSVGFGDYGARIGAEQATQGTDLQADRDNILRAYTEGYTTPDGIVWAPGGEAVWEYLAGGRTGPERAIADAFMTPIQTLGDSVTGGIRGVGERVAEKAPLVGKAIVGAARVADFPLTAGLSEAVPGAFKAVGAVGRKTGVLAPTGTQLKKDVTEAGAEAASIVAGTRRETGAVGTSIPTVQRVARDVVTITDPEGGVPPLTYRTRNGTIDGIIDNPADLTAVRPVTEADYNQILDVASRVDYPSYREIQEPWFRSMFDHRPAGSITGDSYLETRHPDLPVPMGRNADAYQRYRTMMTERLRSDTSPDRAVLRGLLGDWEETNRTFRDLAGAGDSERRLHAIKDIIDASGTKDPYSDQLLAEADAKLNRGAQPYTGQMVTRRGTRGLVPLDRLAQDSLRAQENLPPDAYWSSAQRGARRSGDMAKIISTKPSTNPMKIPLHNTYQEQLARRLDTYGERELVAIRGALDGPTGMMTRGPAEEVESLIDAVNASGVLPRPVSSAGELIRTIDALRNAPTPEWPALPPGITTKTSAFASKASPAPAGTYKTAVEQSVQGALPPDVIATMEMEHTSITGRTEKLFEVANRHQDQLENLRALAQRDRDYGLTAAQQKTLDAGITRLQHYAEFGGNARGVEKLTSRQLADFTDQQIDNLAARQTGVYLDQAQGLRDATGKLMEPGYYKGVAGKVLKGLDAYTGYRRTMSLYSTIRGPAYVLMQALGNGFTLALTKPAALKRYTPLTTADIVRFERDMVSAKPPAAIALRDAVGLGRNKELGATGRDQIGRTTFFAGKDKHPLVKGIGQIVANPAIKEWADAFDTGLRQAVWLADFEPAYRKLVGDLPETASRGIEDIAAAAGVPIGLNRDLVDRTVESLGDRFTGVQLRDALIDAGGGRAAPNGNVLYRAADRVSRDYINAVRTIDTRAIDEVNRLGFDFRETNADAVMSRLWVFHYWMSRASVLYATEVARDPLKLSLMARAIQAGENKASAGRPDYQKDFVDFVLTPTGMLGMFNPAYLVGSWFMMNEMRDVSPMADLTWLGSLLDTGFVGGNLMLNPAVGAAIYTLGLGGADFRPPDVLGTGKWTNDLNTWLDKANQDIAAFYTTRDGTPQDVPNLDSRTLLSRVADVIRELGLSSGFYELAPLTPYDGDRTTQANMSWRLLDLVAEQHPELDQSTEEGAAELSSMVEEALANPDGQLYQQAYQDVNDANFIGFGTGNGAIGNAMGYLTRLALPFGVTSQVASRNQSAVRGVRDQELPIDKWSVKPDAMGRRLPSLGGVEYATPEKIALDNAANAADDAMTAKQRTINDVYSGINDGTIESIDIGGRTWTGAELAALPADDRKTLAAYWMDVNDYWTERQAGFDARDAAVGQNDALQTRYAMKDYAAQYEGGPEQFIEDTALVNPNYRRYIEGLQKQVESGQMTQEEFLGIATNSNDAAMALLGQRSNRFDPNPVRTGAGRVAGLEGTSLPAWQSENADAPFTWREDDQTQLSGELGKYNEVVGRLDQLDGYYGLEPGTLSAQYTEDLLNGANKSGYNIEYEMSQLLRGEGFSASEYDPGTDGQLKWYLDWAGQQGGGDISLPTYWKQDQIRVHGEKVARINAGLSGELTPEQTGIDPNAAPDEAATPSITPPTGAPSVPDQIGGKLHDVWGGVVNAIRSIGGQGPAPGVAQAAGQKGQKPADTTAAAVQSAPQSAAPSKYGPVPTPQPGQRVYFDVVQANDGMGVQSTAASDRTWMEDMIGHGHAQVNTEYKGPEPTSCLGCYGYQDGHGAATNDHAAYDIGCDNPDPSQCPGTPIYAPLDGVVACAGYGVGTSAMPGETCYYSANMTNPNNDGSPAAHTVTVVVGQDVNGNDIELSFNHMGTSQLQPGQHISTGDLIGGMGNTDGGPHVHLQANAYCPSTGTYVIVDPQLVVGGYYQGHAVC